MPTLINCSNFYIVKQLLKTRACTCWYWRRNIRHNDNDDGGYMTNKIIIIIITHTTHIIRQERKGTSACIHIPQNINIKICVFANILLPYNPIVLVNVLNFKRKSILVLTSELLNRKCKCLRLQKLTWCNLVPCVVRRFV